MDVQQNDDGRFERKVIFAVDKGRESDFKEWARLNDFEYTEGKGMSPEYGEEVIFLAFFDDMWKVAWDPYGEWLAEQEYVLVLEPQEPKSNGRRAVSKLNPLTGMEPLGKLTRVTEEEAKASGVWAQFGGDYWIAKEDPVLACGFDASLLNVPRYSTDVQHLADAVEQDMEALRQDLARLISRVNVLETAFQNTNYGAWRWASINSDIKGADTGPVEDKRLSVG